MSQQTSNILLVAEDATVRQQNSDLLRQEPTFHVTTAETSEQALNLLNLERYDVVLLGQTLPPPGELMNVLSQARKQNPDARIAMLGNYPALSTETAQAISEAEQITVQPTKANKIIDGVRNLLSGSSNGSSNQDTQPRYEQVAQAIEQNQAVIQEQWFTYVNQQPNLAQASLTKEKRVEYVAPLLDRLVTRLRSGTARVENLRSVPRPIASAAQPYGQTRARERYTATMVVDEFRLLGQAVADQLDSNRVNVDPRILIEASRIIADELNQQLSEAMTSFVNEQDRQPISAA